jgi:prepilin-type N-terminal cleavage/methylation domain-containing protein
MKKGFTLIELLVVLAIFSVLAVVSSTILISFFRSENKIVATNNVRQFASTLIDTFERDVRNSQYVTTSCGTDCVTLNDSDGVVITWQCKTVASVPYISRTKVVGLNPEPEINYTDKVVKGTTLVNCGVFTVGSGQPTLVTLIFSLQNGTSESKVVVPFRTSVSNRQY